MFFVLSKVFFFFVQPSNLALLAALLALVLARLGWRRMMRAMSGLALGLVILATLVPAGNLMLSFLESRVPDRALPERLAGIVLLGGILEDNRAGRLSVPMNAAGERFYGTLRLALRHPEARIVVSGGTGRLLAGADAQAEAGQLAEMLIEFGVARERIVIEDASRNTYENAVFSARLVDDEAEGAYAIVTSAWHMPRAILVFEAAGWGHLYPQPVDSRVERPVLSPPLSVGAGFEKFDLAVRELIGLAAYRATGRTYAFLPRN